MIYSSFIPMIYIFIFTTQKINSRIESESETPERMLNIFFDELQRLGLG